ncbi:MAG: four helix bundle protein [Flavobacteriaceae bacterium]|nr:four helix bundle protein [Flavobacteriaceae bacterium]
MGTVKRFEDLEVWRESRKLVKSIHESTSNPPFSKDFTLKDQILRSSSSVMDNIAEGFDRDGNKEFIHFLTISKGSLSETKSQLYRALDFNYISKEEFEKKYELADTIGKQIGGFIKYLQQAQYRGNKFKEPDENYS